MAEKKKILIICFSYLHKDPRVLRQVQWLNEKYEVSTAGFSPTGLENGSFFQINPEDGFISILPLLREKGEVSFHLNFPMPLRKLISALIVIMQKIRKYLKMKSEFDILNEVRYFYSYWTEQRTKILQLFLDTKYDLVIANDIYTLPLAIRYIESYPAKVFLDSHEYHPLEFEDNQSWVDGRKPLADFLCHHFIPKVDAMTTVCQGIADEFEKNFKIKPSIITNATSYQALMPKQTNVSGIRLIHHGMCSSERHIDAMIKVMEFLDERFSLDLMLVCNDDKSKKYMQVLKDTAKDNSKISFLPTVATHEIPMYLNQYDMGLYLLPPTNFNHKFALPNKFFEFVQARLGIAIAPSPEMASIVKQYDLGIVSEDFTPESLAKKLNELTAEKIMYYKNQSHKYAYVLSAEKNKEICLGIIEKLLYL